MAATAAMPNDHNGEPPNSKGAVVMMQTSNPRYFAGGDCVSGGQEVVNAVAEGKRAAAGIAQFIERSLGARAEVARG